MGFYPIGRGDTIFSIGQQYYPNAPASFVNLRGLEAILEFH